MKRYTTPEIIDYGSVGALTGIFGSEAVEDQSFGPNGELVGTGEGSVNQCATRDNATCL